jgi:hypothetical protein
LRRRLWSQRLRPADRRPTAGPAQLPCRLDRTGVIPAGHARRFTPVYDVPAGQAWRLQYRGFEKTEEFIDLK